MSSGAMRRTPSLLLSLLLFAPRVSFANSHAELVETLAILSQYGCPVPLELVDGTASAHPEALYRHIRKDFELRRGWSLRSYQCTAGGTPNASSALAGVAPAEAPTPAVAAAPASEVTGNDGAGTPKVPKEGAKAVTPDPAPEAKPGESTPKGAGVDAKPDYLSKNFSLTAGAVVLNPFKLKQIEDPDATRYRIESGNTEANFVVEAGFRRRWAWLDRLPEASRIPTARQTRSELARLSRALEAEQSLTGRAMDPARIRVLEQERDELAADLDCMKASIPAGGGWDGSLRWDFAAKETPLAARMFLPDDWTIRLGYAAGSSTPSGAASLAGAGDFYIETGLGWNLLRFAWSDDPTQTPVRGSINLETITSWNNDPDLLDIHQRWLVGLSAVFGFPMGLASEERQKPVPIGELVLRVGASRVEIPQFLDSDDNEIEVEHGVPDFSSQWGVGLDAEFNVPVGDTGSYLTLRGTMNSNFDPNPWTALAGYTVPLDFLGTILRGNPGSK